MTALTVALTGALGAVARVTLERSVTRRTGHDFPWGTGLVNVTGSLALGIVVGLATAHGLRIGVESVLGAGFLGGYTTFSTYALETVRLVEERRALQACGYAVLSAVVGMAAATLGLALTGGI